MSAVIRDLNATYRAQPALWQIDFRPEGFAWLVGDARDENVIAFARFGDGRRPARLRRQLLADRARGLAAAAPGRGSLARGDQHRLALLRRLRRRQRPRCHGRGVAVARAAVLGARDAAAARDHLVGAGVAGDVSLSPGWRLRLLLGDVRSEPVEQRAELSSLVR